MSKTLFNFSFVTFLFFQFFLFLCSVGWSEVVCEGCMCCVGWLEVVCEGVYVLCRLVRGGV